MTEWLPGYDAWKLQTPPEYDEPEEREEPDPDREREEAQERAHLDKQWDDYEEDGPMDLEDQLETALDRSFPVKSHA